MNVKKSLRPFLRKLGFDIVDFTAKSHPLAREKKLFESYGIALVLDVGANTGQYAERLRLNGYKGEIISFEPLSEAYEILARRAKTDAHWQAMHFALGNTSCRAEINVAGNSKSSSILEMLPSHIKSAPKSEYVRKEGIEIKTLDSIFSEICPERQNTVLKIDTQGYEERVIEGARQTLPFIDSIQVETSLVPLYKGELLFNDMCRLLDGKGYSLVSITPGFCNKETGQLLQVDGFFHRFQEGENHTS